MNFTKSQTLLYSKKVLLILFIVGLILLIPFSALQFTNEVNWTIFDFIAAGILLFGTGLVIEFVIQKVKKSNHRIIICIVILLTLALVWIELAVGIFETFIGGS